MSKIIETMEKIMDSHDIERVIADTAKKISEEFKDYEKLAIIGIKTRGVPLAKRLQRKLADLTGVDVPVGELDITFYRDDLTLISSAPVVKGTRIDFDVNDRFIILVDDVLYTGRTVRSALDEILVDFGRPRLIRLFVIVDRGNRELPICADYIGKTVYIPRDKIVDVLVREIDGRDEVIVREKEEKL